MDTQIHDVYRSSPAAFLGEFPLLVPLYAVTALKLTQTYKLPPVLATSAKSIVDVHDDDIALSGLLLGPERYGMKVALETLADTSRRGGILGGRVHQGLMLVTRMTIRTDLQVRSLEFSLSKDQQGVMAVSIALTQMPRPRRVPRLLDIVALGALGDWTPLSGTHR
ncbi:MAG TPA: hypothetical protein VF520_13415 [Thermoleophilaceae bacterium]|jgi:hypothetical protein